MALQAAMSHRLPKAYRVQIGGNCKRCGDIEAPCGGTGGQDCKKLNRTFVVPEVEGQLGSYKLVFDGERDFPDTGEVPLGAESLEICVSEDNNPGYAENPDFDGKPRCAICVTLKFAGETPPVCWGATGLKNCCNPDKVRRRTMNDKCCFPREIIVNGKPVPDYCPPQPHWQPGNPEDLNDAPFWPVLDVDLPEDSEFAPVRFCNGELQYRARDIAADGFGVPWGHTRVYSNRLSNSYDLGNGTNWLVLQWPYLAREQSTKGECRIVLVRGTRNALWFTEKKKKSAGGKETMEWEAEFGAQHKLKYTPPEGDKDGLYQIEAPNGHLWEFFEFHDECQRKQAHKKKKEVEVAPGGTFKRHVGSGGQEIYAHYENCRLKKVWRSIDNQITKHQQADEQADEFFRYDYYEDGPNKDRLQYVLHKRMKKELTRAEFIYCEEDDKHGDHGDLKMAATQIKEDNNNKWKNLNVHYYRYHKEAKGTYCQGLLRLALGPEAFRRIFGDNLGQSANRIIANMTLRGCATLADRKDDAELAELADLNLTFDDDRRIKAIIMDGGGRRHSFEFDPRKNKEDYNKVAIRTTETRNDGATVVVDTNYIGQPITEILTGDGGRWINHFKYQDKSARLETRHYPSNINHAVQDVEEPETFPHAGAVRFLEYDRDGYVEYDGIMKGAKSTGATKEKLVHFVYDKGGGEAEVKALSKMSLLGAGSGSTNADDARTINNVSWEGRAAIARRITTFVNIPSSQGGMDGDRDAITETFDKYGNLESLKDLYFAEWKFGTRTEDGGREFAWCRYHHWAISDARAAGSDSAAAIRELGVDETTNIELDDFGRPLVIRAPEATLITNPMLISGTGYSVRPATTLRYDDIDGRVVIAQGPGAGNSPHVAPYEIRQFDRAGRRTATIASTIYPPPGERLPDRSNWCRLSEDRYDNQSQLTSSRVYFNIQGSKADVTRFDYDEMYRLRTAITPGGTMIRTNYDARGLEVRRMMGTSEENLRPLETRIYDLLDSRGGSLGPGRSGGGDGHLSRHILHASPDRVMDFTHDYRGRILRQYVPSGMGSSHASSDSIPQIRYLSYTRQGDWTDRIIGPSTEIGTKGVHTVRSLNARGNPYYVRTSTTRDLIEESLWYRQSGELIRRQSNESEAFSRFVFDGKGRQAISYMGVGTSPPKLRPEGSIIQASVVTFNAAGNPITNESWSRFPNGGGGGLFAQRVYTEFDPLGRPRFISQLKRTWLPTKPGEPQIPWKFKRVPVSAVQYNERGDPRLNFEFTSETQYRKHLTQFDDRGRARRIVRNYVTGMPRRQACDQDIVSEMIYTPDGQIGKFAIQNATGGIQTTTFNYGTSLSSGSSVACSFWLVSVVDPEGNQTRYTRNAQGEIASVTDANGTKHTFTFDQIGRITDDLASPGKDIDQHITSLHYSYNFLGQLRSAATGTSRGQRRIVTCVRDYDPLRGHINSESLGVPGLNGVKPEVRYQHYEGLLQAITYPGGGGVRLSPVPTSERLADSVDLRIRRNSSVSQVATAVGATETSAKPVADYGHIGASTALPIQLPHVKRNGNALVRQSSEGEELDEFLRSVSAAWRFGADATSAAAESYTNTFAHTGVTRSRQAAAALQKLPHDKADRLENVATVDSEKRTQTTKWKNDSVGNAFDYKEYPNTTVVRDTDQPTLQHNRIHNRKNQLAGITTFRGLKWTVPKYDRAGNTIEIPKPESPASRFVCKYDAWNRLVSVSDPSLPAKKQVVAEYAYDAFGRRIAKRRFHDGAVTETRVFCHSHDWRLLEEWSLLPNEKSPWLKYQYAWGLRGQDELLRRIERFRPSEQIGGQAERALTALQDEWYNTTALVYDDGAVRWRYRYGAHGKVTPMDDDGSPAPYPGAVDEWNVFFGGYYRDEETGLYHVRRRTLHPVLGTWLQPDPAGYADGPNLYQYGRGSPVTFVDPSGEIVFTIGLGIGGALAGFFAGGLSGRGGWDWQRAKAGAGSGALVGAGIGLAIDTLGTATPLSAALVGAGIGAGFGSALGGGLLTSRESTNWSGWTRGGVIGGVAGGLGGLFGELTGGLGAGPLGRALVGGTVAASSDVFAQTLSISLGWQQDFSFSQVGLSTLAGAGAGALARGSASADALEGAQNTRLVHMTQAGDAIRASGRLAGKRGLPGDIYAGPASIGKISGWALTRRTGLSPTGRFEPIVIPETAQAAFRKPVPIGIFTAWQRSTGQQFAPRGFIDLVTGEFTRTGINRTQALWYTADFIVDIGIPSVAVGGIIIYSK